MTSFFLFCGLAYSVYFMADIMVAHAATLLTGVLARRGLLGRRLYRCATADRVSGQPGFRYDAFADFTI